MISIDPETAIDEKTEDNDKEMDETNENQDSGKCINGHIF